MGHPNGLAGLKLKGEVFARERELGAFSMEMVTEAKGPEEMTKEGNMSQKSGQDRALRNPAVWETAVNDSRKELGMQELLRKGSLN